MQRIWDLLFHCIKRSPNYDNRVRDTLCKAEIISVRNSNVYDTEQRMKMTHHVLLNNHLAQ
jgi:hypothetical protein